MDALHTASALVTYNCLPARIDQINTSPITKPHSDLPAVATAASTRGAETEAKDTTSPSTVTDAPTQHSVTVRWRIPASWEELMEENAVLPPPSGIF
jgi:hypothetical protein